MARDAQFERMTELEKGYIGEIDIDAVCVNTRERIARCVHCGYEICTSDEAAVIAANGGAIHRDCWEEYASENADEFLKEI